MQLRAQRGEAVPDFLQPYVEVGIDGCWLWKMQLNEWGYGKKQFGRKSQRRVWLAHRWAYSVLVGPIPDGLELDHLCRVRHCVNPAHLEPVNGSTNRDRSAPHGFHSRLWTHCKRGHPFNHANTYRLDGKRSCRVCQRAAVARYQKRKRAL